MCAVQVAPLHGAGGEGKGAALWAVLSPNTVTLNSCRRRDDACSELNSNELTVVASRVRSCGAAGAYVV